MKKLLKLGYLFVVLIGIAATAAADTITTSSCNVDFAVNDSGSFYVRSSQIVPAGSPPGLEASSSISGSNFHLTANSTGYSDTGIVLYFNGGLKLGDLKTVSVSSTGSPVSINLWLDTGGDGNFFAFNSNAQMTGLNGDTYGTGAGGASLDANTSIVITAGNGAGHSYTLAQLQAGVVPGITSNTGASLWIGITNPGSADISGIVVGTAAESALQAGGDRLAATQNADGGWGWPLTGASAQNTVGPIAMGLAKAYSHTGSASQLAALQKARTFLLAKTNTFSPPDGYLAAELDRVFGGNTYKNHVIANYYGPLAAGTYNRNGAGTLYTTASYVTFIRNNRASIPNLAAWDLGMGLVGAASCGASTSEWIAGVKAEINELDGNLQYDVIGLAGAVYGLAFVHEDFDPTAGAHTAASSVNDLAAILAGYQINNGGFPESKNNVVESNQETSYAILALNEVNRVTYLNNIRGASNYLMSEQLATGGWNGESGGSPADENNEVTGEVLWAISTSYTLAADSDCDGTPDVTDLCPNDPNKTAPGQCGCGVADIDTDHDGTPNCHDLCPNDPNKTSPGICGCGVADTDTDGDGTPNCIDGCPSDPNKTQPGQCGCGVPETPCCSGSCPVRNSPSDYYSVVQTAYDTATNGIIIQSQALEFSENVHFDHNISVTLKGGYDPSFTNNPSYTTIHGSMTISNGTVVVERIIIK